MADEGKVVVNLATGLEENRERVMLAFFAAESALAQGKRVLLFISLDAVRIGIPGHIDGVIPCVGCPTLDKLYNQLTRAGIEIYACPICLNARAIERSSLLPDVRPAGTAEMMKWIGPGDATVFSY